MLQTMNNNTTTTTKSCHNTFYDLINGEYINRNTLGALNQSFFAIDKGIVHSINCGDYCCPDCGGIYYFGKATRFSQVIVPNVFKVDDLTPSAKLECCVKYIGLDITQSGLNSMVIYGDVNTPVGYDLCTTGNFNTCLQQLQSILTPTQYNDLLVASDGGIVEYSTFGGSSMLCNIISQIQLSPAYTPELLYNYLYKLISEKEGFVIKCVDAGQYEQIASGNIQTFLIWYGLYD